MTHCKPLEGREGKERMVRREEGEREECETKSENVEEYDERVEAEHGIDSGEQQGQDENHRKR
jgi:hypothetical protein